MSLEALMEQLGGASEPEPEISREQKAGLAGTLLEDHQEMLKEYTFAPGDLVQFKRRMGTKKIYGGVAVVRTILDKPVMDTEKGSGSTYFREPLDLVVGQIDKDGHFLEFYLDSRRLEPYTGPMPEDI